MSRKRILITAALCCAVCFSARAMTFELSMEDFKGYLKPWCTLKNTNIKNLKTKFSDEEEGAFNFSLECTRALRGGFDRDNLDNSRLIQAKVVFGLIFLAHYIYENQEEGEKNIALLYRIKDGIKMLNNRSVVKKKLKDNEQKYLDEIYAEKIPVQSNKNENESDNMEIDDNEE